MPEDISPEQKHRVKNLTRMRRILERNTEACALAERLWRFYGGRLKCSEPKELKNSRISYGIPKEFAPEYKATDLTPSVVLAQSNRLEEALVHELLHLELVRLGYPRFFLDGTGDGELAFGITNNADHAVMRPLFAALGYSPDRFTGPNELNDYEKQIIAEIDAFPNLHSTEGYTAAVSSYLKQHEIGFRLTYVRA